jgi:hypothetical protein
MHRIILLGLLFLSLPSASLRAQEIPQLKPGVRVRVTAPTVAANRIVGTVMSVDADQVILKGKADRISIVPLAAMTRLEVSRKKWSGKGALAGAGMGLLLGGLAGGIVGRFSETPGDEWYGMRTFVGLVMGSGSGLAFGAVVGALPRERWSAVSMPSIRQGLGPGQSRPFMFSMTVRF